MSKHAPADTPAAAREIAAGLRGHIAKLNHRVAYDEGFAAGRQQERERLEPLRAAVEAAKKIEARFKKSKHSPSYESLSPLHSSDARVAEAARTLLEQTE